MNEQMTDDRIFIFIALGTTGFFILAVAIIIFIVTYQRRIFNKQKRISELQTQNQKDLLDAVLTTKELEQKRIAQELHDEIGSSINALKMSLINMDIPDETKKHLNSDLQSISKNVRRVSNELMPSVLDELGLHQAIVHLIKKYKESLVMNIDIKMNLIDPYNLDKSTELSIYRIVQELINNICKYAEATDIKIKLKHTEKIFDLTIEDNGKGFLPSEEVMTKVDSLGLKNIKSRIQQINGLIFYSLVEPKGTRVIIQLNKE